MLSLPDTENTGTPPKHREISRQLLAEVATGKYAADGRMPSEAQLVKRFQVSRPTIARALRDLQAEGLIERRAGSGTYVRLQPPTTLNPRRFGLLVPNLSTIDVFGQICGELASVARANEYTLALPEQAPAGPDRELSEARAIELCGQFIERRVSGVFFAAFEFTSGMAKTNRQIAGQLSHAGIPVVLLDRDIVPFPHRTNFDLVSLDNFAAGSLLAEHLIKLGCRRLAFVSRPMAAATVDGRIAGVRDSLARHQLESPPDWVHIGEPEDLKFARSLVSGGRWDAIICATDHTAARLLRSLEKCNVRVPEDVRVAGFDDDKHATLVGVSLTTVHQPCRDIAISAYRAMLDRIAEPALPARTIFLTPQLVVRESCGAYLPGRVK